MIDQLFGREEDGLPFQFFGLGGHAGKVKPEGNHLRKVALDNEARETRHKGGEVAS